MNISSGVTLQTVWTRYVHFLSKFSITFMNELKSISSLLVTLKSDELVWTILNGEKKNDNDSNIKRLTATIKFKKDLNDLRPSFELESFCYLLNVYIYTSKYFSFSLTVYKGAVRNCFRVAMFFHKILLSTYC